jgi:hypothetical protein
MLTMINLRYRGENLDTDLDGSCYDAVMSDGSYIQVVMKHESEPNRSDLVVVLFRGTIHTDGTVEVDDAANASKR